MTVDLEAAGEVVVPLLRFLPVFLSSALGSGALWRVFSVRFERIRTCRWRGVITVGRSSGFRRPDGLGFVQRNPNIPASNRHVRPVYLPVPPCSLSSGFRFRSNDSSRMFIGSDMVPILTHAGLKENNCIWFKFDSSCLNSFLSAIHSSSTRTVFSGFGTLNVTLEKKNKEADLLTELGKGVGRTQSPICLFASQKKVNCCDTDTSARRE